MNPVFGNGLTARLHYRGLRERYAEWQSVVDVFVF